MHSACSRRPLALSTFFVALIRLSLTSPLGVSNATSLESSSASASLNLSSLLTHNGSFDVHTNSPFYDVFPAAVNADFQCDGGRYGQNLDRAACQDALQKIGNSVDYIPTAQRGLGRRPKMPLPNRYSSSDGKCVIDLITAPGVYSDSISERDITQAAQRVIDGCVRQTGPTEGGSLGEVGLSRNLIVVVRLYKPSVDCGDDHGRPPLAGSCSKPIGLMPADTQHKIFGYKNRPGVQEIVPRSFRAAISRCVVTIDAHPMIVSGRWFDIWAGAVAVNALCVNHGQAGMAYGIGQSGGDIVVTLREKRSPAVADS